MRANLGADGGYTTATEFFACVAVNAKRKLEELEQERQNDSKMPAGLGAMQRHFGSQQASILQQNVGYMTAMEQFTDEDIWFGEDNEEEDEDTDDENGESEPEISEAPSLTVRQNFQEYVKIAQGFIPFQKKSKDAINLMGVLRKTKASLETYDKVMEWHLKANGDIHPHESIRGNPEFLSRQTLFENLQVRYNMDQNYNNVSKIVLPHCKSKVKVVTNDAELVLQSLLTDPRIKASDYLFDGNNPFAPPPQSDKIRDLNTGLAVKKTYDALITDPTRQVLLPTPIYIDGASVGQFVDFEVTAVKISLGIFTRKARDKPHFWRNLGYVPMVEPPKSRGKRILVDTEHMESYRAAFEMEENEGEVADKQDAIHAQDFHTMLDKVFEGYVKLQKKGFIWDLFYNGKVYKGVEFIPFVPFIKCDTEEADKLCGAYTNRNQHVSQLCRYCKCPTNESDKPLAKYPMKTQAQIQRLIDQNDLDALKNLSQQCIDNACYKLKFGQHNQMGAHGATPLEMLHALSLGIFKYVRDQFFDQVGGSSQWVAEIEGLAMEIGKLLHRQSSRNKPKTKFGTGIQKGKKMGKEYTGILLNLLMLLRTDKGQELLGKIQRKKGQADKTFSPIKVENWVLLLETLLEWEEWLRSEEMKKFHVLRARKKHRYIMHLVKRIGNRTKGMGLKLTKFHCIMHIADDILNFGVPMEVDTSANESHHKPTKSSAKLTQKNKETFDEQAAQRLMELDLLELAMEEMKGRPLWNYYEGFEEEKEEEGETTNKKEKDPYIEGATLKFFEENGELHCQTTRKKKGETVGYPVEKELMQFVVDLEKAVAGYVDSMPLYNAHHRNGQIFRASAQYRGNVWRDWVIVDWDDHGHLPNKLWGFVDLTALPENSGINYGGLISLEPGLYAIVESAKYCGEEHDSELVRELLTDCRVDNAGNPIGYTFYLADVEAFVDPCIVIPNLGGPANGYLLLRERDEWRGRFEEWLEKPHHEDTISDSEGEESD